MFLTNTKKENKKREIKLSRHEQETMQFDNDYYFSSGKFYYTIGLVEQPRLRKMIGHKNTYYIVKYNDKDVKFVEKAHDITTAQFELSWALNSDTYNQMFSEMRKSLHPDKSNKNVQDRKVNPKDINTTEKTITELGILSGIVTGYIDTSDLDKSDIDSFIKLETNRTLKRSKKDKARVLIIPDSLPEGEYYEWTGY